MNNADFPEESDSSDEDYIPGNGQAEVVSEVDSDGDPEDPLSDQDDVSNAGRKKRRKKTSKTRKKAKRDSQDDCDKNEEVNEKTVEEKKKQADDLWASFKKDTGFKSKTNKNETVANKGTKETPVENQPPSKPQEKITVTEIFEFAGEEVKVEKQVDVNSAEARLFSKASGSVPPKAGRARGGLSGMASVLSHLGKKQKISTLEKSKLDWDKFKKEENIEEELQTHNKGKDGYLERQDFLQRADLRRFEIEKEFRTIERNKRMNDV